MQYVTCTSKITNTVFHIGLFNIKVAQNQMLLFIKYLKTIKSKI